MMGRNSSTSSASRSDRTIDFDAELESPFGRLETLRRSDLRETAYELFFMSCRSSPGFGGGRSALNYYTLDGGGGDGSPTSGGPKGGTGMMVVNSRIKKALGLKARRPAPMRTMSQSGGNGGPNSPGKLRRPMTSAEIMRQQMRVTDPSDNRLRKTLMRTLVGQVGRRVETIILPLELLRQLKPSEFNDMQEYYQWQRRQLRILEAGLLLYPPIPLDRLNSSALRLREVIRSSEQKPIDTSKNSEAMRNLCNSVVALAWRSTNGSPTEVCHWADGYPMNVHLYSVLLQSLFDLREETVVLDEVDELTELMKKTWSTLGINRMIHNACFTWVLFQQYVITGEIEPDLICAALAMLVEVANDAKRSDREPNYLKVLSSVLTAIQGWTEKRLLDYHEKFHRGTLGNMENILSLALSTTRIIAEDVPSMGTVMGMTASGNRVDYYIRSSMRNAFTKIFENGAGSADSMIEAEQDPSEILIELAKETEELALVERETFSPVLSKWLSNPTAAAVVTIHNCYGIVLKQYLAKVTCLTNDLVRVLQSAGQLEKFLVQMVVEDSADCEDGGKGIVREMIPYEVDIIVVNLLKTWIDERLRIGKECVKRAKETESWIPRSKSEPYAQSAVDLMKLAKVTVDEFFEIPVGARDDMVQDLADGLESIFQDYISLVASCGSKQTYVPALPPLTRCSRDSTVVRLWKKASSPCNAGVDMPKVSMNAEGHQPKPSTSRGTQRLYIRLNTLHYVLAHLHALDKSLSFFSRGHGPSPSIRAANSNRRLAPSYHFDLARSSVQSAIQHVSEVAAYRLIFLDSHQSFYDGLYLGDVADARICPALRILKQNLTLLISMLIDRAQPVAVKEVLRAAFEAFLMVLLAGGSERAFLRSDHQMILEDLRSLKKAFCTCGEGLVAEEAVDSEAEVVEGIVGLMGLPTERLIEDFSIAACEASGLGGAAQKLPMPPTTGRWNRTDPNTILRVLCHRVDDTANYFLKKTFLLPKRR
ncbi:protein unc-13 homolog [Elaeis guineensis]|uniref:Protein unc-13 homolog n=1 Tax=Elaeis guineensis var. tenera TaxID=51953 RepID=A0A6I9S6I0_ELAGV|nr:protein unc-13 homolog [Elaeis guineensis]